MLLLFGKAFTPPDAKRKCPSRLINFISPDAYNIKPFSVRQTQNKQIKIKFNRAVITCLFPNSYGKIFLMRMHRKSRLDERLEECRGILTVADLSEKNMKKAAQVKEYLAFNALFGNNNPIELEIGCGKGKFVCELALREKNVNYIAVEKISNVLIEACEKVKELGISNVHFLNCAAEVLPKYLPEGSVRKIYLNFSNPLPKLGYVKQRLTHPVFLEEYKRFLTSGGVIVQKTDDYDFYKFSVESFSASGYEILEQCEDLAALGDKDNIVTEHEKRFSDMGKKIYRVVAKLK